MQVDLVSNHVNFKFETELCNSLIPVILLVSTIFKYWEGRR